MPESIQDIVLRLARAEIARRPIPIESSVPSSIIDDPNSTSTTRPRFERTKSPEAEPAGSTQESASIIDPRVTGASLPSSPGHSNLDTAPAATEHAELGARPSLPRTEDETQASHENLATPQPPLPLSSILYLPSSTPTTGPALKSTAPPAREPPPSAPGASRWSSPGPPNSIGPASSPSAAASGDSGADRISDSVADQARRLEQLSRDLDSSLTRLFATQLESLDHLRQRLDEHERLWLEQQALRRAAL